MEGRCLCFQMESCFQCHTNSSVQSLLIAVHLSMHRLVLVKVSCCISLTPIITLPLADLAEGKTQHRRSSVWQ